MAKSGWARYATHMSKVGGLFLGPISEKSNFTKMFKLLVPEKEALLGLSATNKPETAKKIAERAKMPLEKAEPMLQHMAQKGLLFERVTKRGISYYNVPPFIPGFYEYVMTDPETIHNPEVGKLFRAALDEELGPLLRFADVQGGGLMKVTPVMKEIHAQQKVYSFEDVLTFINNSSRYSVADCACRTAAKLVGKGCEHPIHDTCMQFDETADYYVRTGRGHYLTKEEAIQTLEMTEKAGLAHCAFQVKEKTGQHLSVIAADVPARVCGRLTGWMPIRCHIPISGQRLMTLNVWHVGSVWKSVRSMPLLWGQILQRRVSVRSRITKWQKTML